MGDPTEPRDDNAEPTKAEILEEVREIFDRVKHGRFEPTASELLTVVEGLLIYLETGDETR